MKLTNGLSNIITIAAPKVIIYLYEKKLSTPSFYSDCNECNKKQDRKCLHFNGKVYLFVICVGNVCEFRMLWKRIWRMYLYLCWMSFVFIRWLLRNFLNFILYIDATFLNIFVLDVIIFMAFWCSLINNLRCFTSCWSTSSTLNVEAQFDKLSFIK